MSQVRNQNLPSQMLNGSDFRSSANHSLGEVGPATAGIIEVDPEKDPRWESFVMAHPDGLISHHPAWLQVISEAYGHTPACLAYQGTNGNFLGILPLFYTHGLLAGRYLSSVPHTPLAGPLAYDEQIITALVHGAVERVRAEPGLRLELRVTSSQLGGQMDGLVGVPRDPTYVLELPKQPNEMRFGTSRHHAAIKRAVNKAARLGVVVRPAETKSDLRSWYKLYLTTMRWHATPPRPYRFFEVVWELLQPRNMMQLLLAEHYEAGQRRLLAGSLFLMFGQTIVFAFNGSQREALSLRPNDAIHWHAIHNACREGFRWYDFGEVDETNEGLTRFKEKWDAKPRALYRFYSPAPPWFDSGILRAGSRTRHIANACWQRVPLSITAVVGGWIYRNL